MDKLFQVEGNQIECNDHRSRLINKVCSALLDPDKVNELIAL